MLTFKNKIGQMKIQQMAFMLVAVTLFFVFVGLFFAMIIFSDVKKSAEILEEKEAILLVSKIANSPEFSCGNSFGSTRINCIDSDKLMALKKNLGKYSGFWGVSGIKVRKTFPKEDRIIECSSENYPDCTEITFFSSSGTGVSNFAALCRKEKTENSIQDKCEIANIIVYYGEKND